MTAPLCNESEDVYKRQQYHRSLYYDLCAKWGTSAYFKPLVGLGVRYYQSLGNTGKDRLCLYVSIGFRFN